MKAIFCVQNIQPKTWSITRTGNRGYMTGEAEVKHGINVPIANFYSSEVGNSALPTKFKQQARLRARKRRKFFGLVGVAVAAVSLAVFLLLHYLAGRQFEKSIAVLPFENL